MTAATVMLFPRVPRSVAGRVNSRRVKLSFCWLLVLFLAAQRLPASPKRRPTRNTLQNLKVQPLSEMRALYTSPRMPGPMPPADRGAELTEGVPQPSIPAASSSRTVVECDVLLAVPTLPRAENYLGICLSALLCQLPDAAPPRRRDDQRFCIAVYNVRPTAQRDRNRASDFDRARSSLAHRPDVLFFESNRSGAATALPASATKVERTRRQTADVAYMMLKLSSAVAARYLVLLEDDWMPCEGGSARDTRTQPLPLAASSVAASTGRASTRCLHPLR
jgi:hypothetical protein